MVQSRQIADLEFDILCGVVYNPPEYTKYASADPFSEVQNELDIFKLSFSQVLMFDDFNARTGELNEFVVRLIPPRIITFRSTAV